MGCFAINFLMLGRAIEYLFTFTCYGGLSITDFTSYYLLLLRLKLLCLKFLLNTRVGMIILITEIWLKISRKIFNFSWILRLKFRMLISLLLYLYFLYRWTLVFCMNVLFILISANLRAIINRLAPFTRKITFSLAVWAWIILKIRVLVIVL
jgi:hypothetical protein